MCYLSDSYELSTQDINLCTSTRKGEEGPSYHSWVTTTPVSGMSLCWWANSNKHYMLSLWILKTLSYNTLNTQTLELEPEGQKKSICKSKQGKEISWHFGRQLLKRGVAGTGSRHRLQSTKCSKRNSTMVYSFYRNTWWISQKETLIRLD